MYEMNVTLLELFLGEAHIFDRNKHAGYGNIAPLSLSLSLSLYIYIYINHL